MSARADRDKGAKRGRARKAAPGSRVRETLRGGKGGGGHVARRPARQLNVCAYAILVALFEWMQPENAYRIVKALSDEGMFTPSSVYREIGRLVEEGYLESSEELTQRGPLRLYVPTMKGVEAVKGWVPTPAAVPLEVVNETWLRIQSIRFSHPRDVLKAFSPLADEVEERMIDLDVLARRARRNGSWDIAGQLEYELQRALLDACERWAGEATRLLEAEIERRSGGSAGP
jgi:DNA-binding PadR family transcriptional regulator